MNCSQIRDRLLAWHYGELPAAEGALVGKHLENCVTCREQALAWHQLRGKLAAFRPPAIEVDLSRLYRQAVEHQERRHRRWRRAALAVMVAAAAALMAVFLKLELRFEATQVVLTWRGTSTAMPPAPPPPPPAQAQLEVPPIHAEDLELVKDLVRVLAKEIQARDHQQQEKLLRLQTRFETLLGWAFDHWAANERDLAALYAAQFRFQKGENR